jgi:hypothetical protein
MSMEKIAEKHGRTKGAIESRLKKRVGYDKNERGMYCSIP